MKCIKLLATQKVYRVNDSYADYLVRMGLAQYTNKTNWKSDGRKYLEGKKINE